MRNTLDGLKKNSIEEKESKIMKLQRMFANLEEYEVYDDKRLKDMSDYQREMALEDERAKAKRNTSKIIKERADEGAIEGRARGKKKGTKVGAIVGGIGGAIAGAALGHNNKKVAAGLAIGTAIGTGAGALLGRASGAASGEESGRAEGAKKGRKEAKEQGHDEVDVMKRHARRFDEYARAHKKEDKWEMGVRKKLSQEEEERKAEAARKRAEELERRRVAAEEARANAEKRKADTDRYRYHDEHWGTGQYSRDRQNSSTSYTQNNYYR